MKFKNTSDHIEAYQGDFRTIWYRRIATKSASGYLSSRT